MAKRSTAGLVKYVKFLMDAGVMERPVWLEALERVPPPPLPQPGRRPPTIRFPEDDIIRAYYRRHPNASLEPIDLGSFEPTTAKRFASRQLELIEQGMPRRAARDQAEKEFSEAAAVAKVKGIIAIVQKEEEGHLEEALKTYTDRHGHGPYASSTSMQMASDRATKRTPRGEAVRDMPAPPVKTMTTDAPVATRSTTS